MVEHAVRNPNNKRELEADAEPVLRTLTKREDELDLRSIYNSAVGVIEALEARGFGSDSLIDSK